MSHSKPALKEAELKKKDDVDVSIASHKQWDGAHTKATAAYLFGILSMLNL